MFGTPTLVVYCKSLLTLLVILFGLARECVSLDLNLSLNSSKMCCVLKLNLCNEVEIVRLEGCKRI